MYKRIKVRKHELALWFREGELHKVLKAGVYRLSSLVWFPGRNSIQKVDLTKPRFEHPMLQVLVKDVRLAKRLAVVDLAEDERALVWVRGRLADILEPGVHAYWIDLVDVEIERFDVNSLWFEHAKREAILNFPGSSRYFNGIRVDANERVIVYRDGELDRQLDAGHFIYWRSGANVTWKSVDLREQSADIQGQEIMTADKVTLRMN
ncbi:MAG: SPFH domain-containing protein, partial [Planctomycetota bacterium]